jgi:hypothetical protein
MLDKSGNGNHATASADARRPVLSARVNLLEATETLSTQNVTVVPALYTLSFTNTGTVTLSGASTDGPLVGTGATDRVSLAFTPTAGSLTLTVSGTVTDADLRVTNDGVGIPAYQRVTSSTDYDTAGFPLYLRFDGTDDCLVTGNVDFSATDKVTVCAGVRKLSEPEQGTVVELTITSTAAGAFSLLAGNPTIATRSFAWSVAADQNFIGSSQFPAPSTVVDTVVFDRRGTTASTRILPRLNGAPASLSETTSATVVGNFANAPLFVGARNDSTNRLTGRLYQMAVRGALTGTPLLEQLEGFVNQKTRAY